MVGLNITDGIMGKVDVQMLDNLFCLALSRNFTASDRIKFNKLTWIVSGTLLAAISSFREHISAIGHESSWVQKAIRKILSLSAWAPPPGGGRDATSGPKLWGTFSPEITSFEEKILSAYHFLFFPQYFWNKVTEIQAKLDLGGTWIWRTWIPPVKTSWWCPCLGGVMHDFRRTFQASKKWLCSTCQMDEKRCILKKEEDHRNPKEQRENWPFFNLQSRKA